MLVWIAAGMVIWCGAIIFALALCMAAARGDSLIGGFGAHDESNGKARTEESISRTEMVRAR